MNNDERKKLRFVIICFGVGVILVLLIPVLCRFFYRVNADSLSCFPNWEAQFF